LVPGLSNATSMVHAPTNDFHDLPVSNEPLTTTPATTLETKYSKSVYQKCTVKNENEQAPPNQGTKDLYIPITLFPGTNLFRIRQINGNPDSRAIMIATSLANRPIPTFILAGQRRRGKPLPKKQPPFAAPFLLAKKPKKGIRICYDYRELNSVTVKNWYLLPLIREILNQISRAKYYTKLNIIAAFNKIRITKGYEWKIAFITRFGLFEIIIMPFGLCNALANFQNYINQLLWNILDKYYITYFDDVFIYFNSRIEHYEHVRKMVKRLLDTEL
jgi:hypothetical protein